MDGTQGQVNCPHIYEDIMMGSGTAMTDDHVEKNSGHSCLQECREGAGGGTRGTRHADSDTMSSSYRRLPELAGFNSNIRLSDPDDKTVKTMDTIQESLSKLCMNRENKIRKFIFLKRISQH